MFKLSDFDYSLPQGLIAQAPSPRREHARLLVFDRSRNSLEHRRFCDIIAFLKKGDLLVLNDTRVIPARLLGRRLTGGRVELLLLRPASKKRYFALIKPLGRLKDGEEIFLDKGFSCRLLCAKDRIVAFDGADARRVMKKAGLLPLPPYIRRSPSVADDRRYQTVFAKKEGAVAAPTAGLHFTKRLLAAIRKKGVRLAYLTLHVNYATFSSVRSEDIRQHRLEPEYFEIPAGTAELLLRTKREGGRVFAVGTTVCKALEDSTSALLDNGKTSGRISRWSDFFIYPPFSFRVVDALVTNFHLPRTTLLMLVSAFAGRESIFAAYEEAVRERYRFYSYGDAMLIL